MDDRAGGLAVGGRLHSSWRERSITAGAALPDVYGQQPPILQRFATDLRWRSSLAMLHDLDGRKSRQTA